MCRGNCYGVLYGASELFENYIYSFLYLENYGVVWTGDIVPSMSHSSLKRSLILRSNFIAESVATASGFLLIWIVYSAWRHHYLRNSKIRKLLSLSLFLSQRGSIKCSWVGFILEDCLPFWHLIIYGAHHLQTTLKYRPFNQNMAHSTFVSLMNIYFHVVSKDDT